MQTEVIVGLALTLASACALNWGYLREHGAASKLPRLDVRRPLRSLRLLVGSRRWLSGFGWETLGFGLYVAALALAPLALVQAVAAGGIGVLALLAGRVGGGLDARERLGVGISIGGLALLGISLAGGSEEGGAGSWPLIALWLGASAGAAALAIGSGATILGGGAAFGLAAGILFAAGDVTTKAAVSGGDHVAVGPAIVAFYGAGTIVLQMGFQRGRALTTAGIATLCTNAIPIAAAMTLFAEPLPDGPLGVVRVLSFAAVVGGAVALAPHRGRPAQKYGPDSIADGAPLGQAAGMGGTILCDVTDPQAGRVAAEFAGALGARLGVRVVLVHVLADLPVVALESVSGRQRQGGAQRQLATLAGEQGGAVDTRLVLGDHAEELARVAAEEGADLVIVGSRPAGFGGRKLRCTLVRDLEAETPVPVLVAPPSTRRRSERRLALAVEGETR